MQKRQWKHKKFIRKRKEDIGIYWKMTSSIKTLLSTSKVALNLQTVNQRNCNVIIYNTTILIAAICNC